MPKCIYIYIYIYILRLFEILLPRLDGLAIFCALPTSRKS